MKTKYTSLCEVEDVEGYKDPYGIWEITTEADVEGRSTKKLGIFEGYLPDILKILNDKCYYNFFVKKFKEITLETEVPHISELKIYMNFPYNFSTREREEATKSIFKDDFIDNHGDKCYCGVTIYCGEMARKRADEERKKKIAKAMSKLTKEERELLGIIGKE